MEVGGQRLGPKLPHHQSDLTTMVSGMVRQMLHQVRQAGLCCAKRKHFPQGFVRHAIHELGLFFFDFRLLSPHRGDVGKCIRMEQGLPPLSQICQEGGARGPLLPIRKPTPLAGDDVYERVSHGAKAAAQIARELLIAERGRRLQNPVVRPAVVFVEQLNFIAIHVGGRLTRASGEFYLAMEGQSYYGFVGGSAGASAAPLGLAIVESVSTLNFL